VAKGRGITLQWAVLGGVDRTVRKQALSNILLLLLRDRHYYRKHDPEGRSPQLLDIGISPSRTETEEYHHVKGTSPNSNGTANMTKREWASPHSHDASKTQAVSPRYRQQPRHRNTLKTMKRETHQHKRLKSQHDRRQAPNKPMIQINIKSDIDKVKSRTLD
jgi:hypothetical protein